MRFGFTRRAVLLGGLMLAAAMPTMAQDKPVLRFSAVFSEQDIRAEMMDLFAGQIADEFTLEPYYGGNLFKQGTELVALQRGNLEMGNIAPQDISNQIPAWSALTSAYVPDYGMILFGTVLATLPTLIIFFLLQRRFVEGMLGAVK